MFIASDSSRPCVQGERQVDAENSSNIAKMTRALLVHRAVGDRSSPSAGGGHLNTIAAAEFPSIQTGGYLL